MKTMFANTQCNGVIHATCNSLIVDLILHSELVMSITILLPIDIYFTFVQLKFITSYCEVMFCIKFAFKRFLE